MGAAGMASPVVLVQSTEQPPSMLACYPGGNLCRLHGALALLPLNLENVELQSGLPTLPQNSKHSQAGKAVSMGKPATGATPEADVTKSRFEHASLQGHASLPPLSMVKIVCILLGAPCTNPKY